MLRAVICAGLVSMLMFSSTAFAQGQGGRGGGRGGFGGFGGGGFGGNDILSLVNREPVQKELGLSEDQIAKLKTLADDIRKEREAQRGDFNFRDLQNLSQEERDKKLAELREKAEENQKKIMAMFKPKLAEIVPPEQMERLQQIVWQAEGTQALLDAELAKELKLTEEQSKKLVEINKAFGEKQREMFGAGFGRRGGDNAGGGDFQERMTKFREAMEARDKDLLAVLTEEQKSEFKDLKGKEFDVSQLRRGFGGPGGRPGQGGRPRGGRPGEGNNPPENNNN